jgi:xanthine dehydrogenase accessory factor
MMDAWLAAAGGKPAVLVTVAIVEGSGPREPGAKMLVDAGKAHGTIGGGHLELRAIEIAREMLAAGEARRLERFALGPSLGQCCGGVVHVAFELADSSQMAALAERRNEETWRLVAIDGGPDSFLCDPNGQLVPLPSSRRTPGPIDTTGSRTSCGGGTLSMGPGVRRDDGNSGPQAGVGPRGADTAPLFARHRGTHVMQEQDGRRWLVDLVAAPRAQLLLFGAGHVGTAVVRALASLPCHVTWIDERDDLFPPEVPPNVTVEATDTPEALVAQAPDGASYLVMTHSHALDQRLSEAILSRPGVGWFGLIGSRTKRKQFEHRLRARGIAEERLATMACPIGVPGITGKEPAVIAIAVAAQLLQVWEAQAAHTSEQAPSIQLVAS